MVDVGLISFGGYVCGEQAVILELVERLQMSRAEVWPLPTARGIPLRAVSGGVGAFDEVRLSSPSTGLRHLHLVGIACRACSLVA